MQTFEDFKNDKQALEYQQRIVDILLQVKSHLTVAFCCPLPVATTAPPGR